MSDLLNDVYLPDFNKRSVRESDVYKFLQENKKDTSVIEGYENTENIEPIEFPSFNSQSDKDKFIEENAASTVSGAKDYIETFGNFLTDEAEDLVTSLQLAAVNGADVAVNLMPLAYKMFETAPIATALPKEFFNQETEGDVMRVAQHYSDNLGEYRKHLFDKQKDNGWVKDILSFVVQDSVYSIPTFNMLKKAGVPKYPAFIISAAVGAFGIENVDKDGDKTYFAPFQKDVQEIKRLLNILPGTPTDKIADEVHQALEYGAFGFAIPAFVDAFVFMKKYLPKFTAVSGTTGAVVGMTADNEAEGSPIKSILKAVDSAPMFKSAVVDAADKIPTVGSGDQIFNTIKNTTGVKESELKWMDLEGFLKGKNKVSKDEVLEYINNNRIDVSEVKLATSQSVNKQSLPDELQKSINDYETRWRDSELASQTGTPNYDQYKFKNTTYASGRSVNDLGEPTQAQARAIASETGEDIQNNMFDWQTLNRSPLIRAMDDQLDLTGDTAEYFDIEKYNLKSQPWFDEDTGKFTAHVVDVDPEIMVSGFDYYIVTPSKNRVVVPSVSLEAFEGNFTKVAKYELEPLELERFLLEDRSRNFKLNNTDQMPMFGKYTEPGGEDYTELVFKIKNKQGTTPAILEGEFGTLANNKVKSEVKTSIDFSGPHFGRMNEFAHVRFKTREIPGPRAGVKEGSLKVLAVEEMQSDLLQASKTEMFSSANAQRATGDKVLKDFPFKNTWYEFTIKRLTRYAADNGFDAIAIPKGTKAANRYGKSIKNLKKIEIRPMEINKGRKKGDEAGYLVGLFDEKGSLYESKSIFGVPGDDGFFEGMKKLEKDVGSNNFAEIQSLVLQADETQNAVTKVFDKVQVTGSGAGKFRLYDQTIPSYMKKYAKKWNAKVYDTNIDVLPNPSMEVTVLELSNEMKTGVTSSSQPLFELFGGVALSTWGAKAVSDSMENNSISQTTN